MSKRGPMQESLAKRDILRLAQPRIVRWFKSIRPPCVEEDECPDAELVDHGEEWIELDEWEKEEGVSVTGKAATMISEHGHPEPSSSEFHTGLWYSVTEEMNSRTGNITEWSFHLYGFSEEEERQVYDELK